MTDEIGLSQCPIVLLKMHWPRFLFFLLQYGDRPLLEEPMPRVLWLEKYQSSSGLCSLLHCYYYSQKGQKMHYQEKLLLWFLWFFVVWLGRMDANDKVGFWESAICSFCGCNLFLITGR